MGTRIYRVASKLADLDLDEQTVADTLESLAGSVEVKATNVAAFARRPGAGRVHAPARAAAAVT